MLIRSGTTTGAAFAALFEHAGYGVDIFFSLSGYLICTLLLEEKDNTATISLSKFYLRRAFRILPPILVYIGVIYALSLSASVALPVTGREIPAVLFFARNYVSGEWYTGHFWSLAVEEHFYLVIPVFLLLLPRKAAIRVSILLVVICISVRWYELAHNLFPKPAPQLRTENRVDALLWGAILALLLTSPRTRAWIQTRLTIKVWAALLIAAVISLTVLTGQPARRTIVALVLPLLIGYTVLRPAEALGRFLEWPLLRWIGRLSYSLYIWQQLCLPQLQDPKPLGVLQMFPLALALLLVSAALSYYCIERPFIRLGHRLAAYRNNSSGLVAD